jgi:peptidoglycan/LPS O-acetylase OafA/YrhL
VWPLATRVLGALATLAVGAVHLQQYLKLYSEVPTIGPLFVLNFAGATVLGVALLTPSERFGGWLGHAAPAFAAIAAIGLAATSFAFLLISEHTPLFGFKEPGYDPTGIAPASARSRRWCSSAPSSSRTRPNEGGHREATAPHRRCPGGVTRARRLRRR